MPLLINSTGQIGQIIQQGTINITGDLAITFVMLFILIISVGLMFKIPIEWLLLFLYPLLSVMVLISPVDTFIKVLFGISLLFFAVIVIRNLFVNG